MATPQAQPPQPGTQTPPPAPATGRARTPDWVHYAAWGAVILGPTALFIPPRRVGLQALCLATGTSYGINILAYNYTGESIYQRTMRRWDKMSAMDPTGGGVLPEKALRTQELMRLERERREAQLPEAERTRLREEREAKERAQRGIIEKLWMGNAKDTWKEERTRKEKEALEEGKGVSDLIVEQFKEVFSSKKENGEEKKDEKSDENKKP